MTIESAMGAMSGPPTPPSDWDTVLIDMDPPHLYELAETAHGAGTQIGDSIKQMLDTWSSLELGWTGTTEQEATDFGARWTAVMSRMFGTDETTTDPAPDGQSVLTKLITIMYAVAANFDAAETAVIDMYNKIAGGPADPDAPADDGHRDVQYGPVYEINDYNEFMWPPT